MGLLGLEEEHHREQPRKELTESAENSLDVATYAIVLQELQRLGGQFGLHRCIPILPTASR